VDTPADDNAVLVWTAGADYSRNNGYCSLGVSARVFVRIMHEKPETAGAKMSALCSFCVHHVAVNGEAVNSNE
jgi:hypothetical protein